MPKVARYIASNLKAKTVAVMFVNNDFGKGGRDAFAKALEARGAEGRGRHLHRVGPGRLLGRRAASAKQSNADALFVYTNEEESARALRELRKQGSTKPIVGETTLTGQKVIELAGDAANGAVAHVGLTVDAPNPLMLKFKAKFYQEYKYISDHNGIKGYTGVYLLKAAHRKSRQGRPRGGGQGAAWPERQRGQGARGADGRDGRRQRRPRPRELHRRSRRTASRWSRRRCRRWARSESSTRGTAHDRLSATAVLWPGHRRDLRPGRARLHAVVAGVGHDQLRAGRVRDAAGVHDAGVRVVRRAAGAELRAHLSAWRSSCSAGPSSAASPTRCSSSG